MWGLSRKACAAMCECDKTFFNIFSYTLLWLDSLKVQNLEKQLNSDFQRIVGPKCEVALFSRFLFFPGPELRRILAQFDRPQPKSFEDRSFMAECATGNLKSRVATASSHEPWARADKGITIPLYTLTCIF